MPIKKSPLFLAIALALLVASAGCTFPPIFAPRSTPVPEERPLAITAVATPTSLPPLPPILIETDPPVGGQVPLQGPITFYFDQSMDKASVEAALLGQPTLTGQYSWMDDATVSFTPMPSFPPESELLITLQPSARGSNGLELLAPVKFNYRTPGFLRLSQALPAPDSVQVDPTSAIVASFNQPVVPLGGAPEMQEPAFALNPTADGTGEWVNTSTYIFYPDPPLKGGETYTAMLARRLMSAGGGPLMMDDPETTWRFTTAKPRVVAIDPVDGASDLPLDPSFRLTFNQPMDHESVAENLFLRSPDNQSIRSGFTWNDDQTVVTVAPQEVLSRDTLYLLAVEPAAQTRSGVMVGEGFQAQYQTVPALRILKTDPVAGGVLEQYRGVELVFSAPIQPENLDRWITFQPAVSDLNTYWDPLNLTVRLWGSFDPATDYTLSISSELSDPWGGEIGETLRLSFRTAPLRPNLFLSFGTGAVFLTPQDPVMTIQATNLTAVDILRGAVPLTDFLRLMGPEGYNLLRSYLAQDQRFWTKTLDLPANQAEFVDLSLDPENAALDPGLYFLRLSTPQENVSPSPFLVVVTDIHLTFKISQLEAVVWAVDLPTNAPVASAQISLYNANGDLLARGMTDKQGVFRSPVPTRTDSYDVIFAVLGEPGQDDFSLALSSWNRGVSGWMFGLPVDYSVPGLKTYLYTDRPIYRPGQTVHVRGVLRQAFNGRYQLPVEESAILKLIDAKGEELLSEVFSLSSFGTFQGAFPLSDNSQPGFYRIESGTETISFQVAAFRKPEIDLELSLTPDETVSVEGLQAKLQAKFFFGAPAGDVAVTWSLFKRPIGFQVPGYRVGPLETGWLLPPWALNRGPLGELVVSGEGQTDSQGTLFLDLPTLQDNETQEYTFEITAQDESGFPVSARAEAIVHPGFSYIGVQAETWVGRANEALNFQIREVDWDRQPVGNRQLTAKFQKIEWVREDSESDGPLYIPVYTPIYTFVAEKRIQTDINGRAEVSFTPTEPGTYQMQAENEGGLTQALVWVGGGGQVVWPALPEKRLQITADRERYLPGDQAVIFIPNPLGEDVQALVTVERGIVMRHWVIKLEGAGSNFSIPLTDEDAPNVYVSVTLLGRDAQGRPDFRQGYLNLNVEPIQQTLNVEITANPERTGPGDQVTIGVRVTDHLGDPVEGEFSLSIVDLATLALAEPNAPKILAAFYSPQPLGVRTGLALAASAQRRPSQSDGVGGGGGEAESPEVRENFLDTAYWNAEIVTDANGSALVSFTLPDNLTTWQIDLRGLSEETQVGQAVSEVVTTKDLLIRPATPRFFIVGDHLQLAAVVDNNTQNTLEVEVSVQAVGFTLDEKASGTQLVEVIPGARERVTWWGTVENVPAVDLTFQARADSLQDAVRPGKGEIPVFAYFVPQTFATAGTLEEGGEQFEMISVPRTFVPDGGELQLELAPSIAAAMYEAFEVLEHAPYESTEQTVSRFLPNLETFRALESLGLESPGLRDRLVRTLRDSVSMIEARQNTDGGWSWWPVFEVQDVRSDPYITAYVLYGLGRAKEAGVIISPNAIEDAVDFLQAAIISPQTITESWRLDRLVFEHFVLTQTGHGDLDAVHDLYEVRSRLNAWAQALLALTLEELLPGDDRPRTLFSDLQSSGSQTASGAYWELNGESFQNMASTIFNSSVVVFALAQVDPAAPLIPEAVRYLVSHRKVEGGWSSTYESAWTLMALTEVMKGTGEFGSDFSYSADLNGEKIADGTTDSPPFLTPVRVSIPLGDLRTADPNALMIRRGPGSGRLYYQAELQVNRPVGTVPALQQGISIARAAYRATDLCPGPSCSPINLGRQGELVEVRLTVVLEADTYFLMVEDFIPAGAEIVDVNLETSSRGSETAGVSPEFFDPRRPYSQGWGWWLFSEPQIFDHKIAWAVDFIPAGTYELSYSFQALQPGEYRILPARAWQLYFPDVQGTSPGQIFIIQP